MSVIWANGETYRRIDYESEADLEKSIMEIKEDLFGKNRYYVDTKRRIGVQGRVQNIPDGYLFDLSSSKPQIFLVENELDIHHHLKHIATQILEFSLSFDTSERKLRDVLISEINNNSELKLTIDEYIKVHNYRSYEILIEKMLEQFNVLVIIDNLSEDLETALTKRFAFDVKIIEVKKYQTENGKEIQYVFEPIFEDIEVSSPNTELEILPFNKLDTIVVPARKEGFQNTFIDENRWYAIKIARSRIPIIKYIAAYQVAPISAITHLAEVENIEQWADSDKFVVNFKNAAFKIDSIILKSPNGRVMAPQNSRYTNYERLIKAKSLDDMW